MSAHSKRLDGGLHESDGGLRVRLLELAPSIRAGLHPDELAGLRAMTVPALRLERGSWDPAQAALHPDVEGAPLWLLVGSGLLLQVTSLGGRAASAIAGPGDLVSVADERNPQLPLSRGVLVAESAIVGVLDASFVVEACDRPALMREIMRRVSDQLRRAGVGRAISQLPRTEDRVLALAWHLAERFGHATTRGVALGLRLTHETMGTLIGAERSTVTLAIAKLEREGLMRRGTDGLIELSRDSARGIGADRDHVAREQIEIVRLVAPRLSSAEQTPTEEQTPIQPAHAFAAAHAGGLVRRKRVAPGAIDVEEMRERMRLAHLGATDAVRRARRICERSARAASEGGRLVLELRAAAERGDAQPRARGV